METTKKTTPRDIVEIYNFLRGMRSEFSDSFAEEIKEPMSTLFSATFAWKHDEGAEPDWQAFRDEINDACRNDGMPILFEATA